MGLISSAANAFFTFKFLRKLTQKWEDMDAYKFGIIDDNGKVLRKQRELDTQEEKDSYTVFDRLAFNIKRLMEKIPFGKSRIASYAAALYLIKENTGMDDTQLDHILDELEINRDHDLQEDRDWFVLEDNQLTAGTYRLIEDTVSPITGEIAAHKNSNVIVENNCMPIDEMYGCPIYQVLHKPSNTKLIVTAKDLTK
tara:strand:- start:296 stop:886 length:591 start_codon:yes stop_codon:yes gene_type:complete